MKRKTTARGWSTTRTVDMLRTKKVGIKLNQVAIDDFVKMIAAANT
jgi:hypothetical protein